jgi:mono/diheme cytochrome c family protein
MAVFLLAALFLLVGGAVVFIAFSGGLGAARENYMTRGGTFFKIAIPLLYVGMGVAIPAVVIASRNQKLGGEGALANTSPNAQLAKGKKIFQQTCSSCHTLNAVNARGLTGPNLDGLAPLQASRVAHAIQVGGSGGQERRMPANLLQGENRAAVAAYVADVAGR